MAINVLTLLRDLQRQGVHFEVAGDRLHVRARQPLPAEVVDTLRAHKAELLRLLAAEADPWPGLLRSANAVDRRLGFILSVLRQFGAEAERTAGGGWLVRAGEFEDFCFWAHRWLGPFRRECEAAGIAWEGVEVEA